MTESDIFKSMRQAAAKLASNAKAATASRSPAVEGTLHLEDLLKISQEPVTQPGSAEHQVVETQPKT